MRGFLSTAFVAAGLTSSALAQIRNPVDSLVIKGSKFFYGSNGTQFFMRGVAYQREYGGNGSNPNTGDAGGGGYNDPLADAAACRRDVPLLAQLRTNVIRTYAIDPTANHDECMQLLNDAGIYVVSDLSQPDQSINRNAPTWDDNLYERYTAVIDSLAKYSNVMGFFAGNEVSNAPNNTAASAFVKAAVRDSKAYIKQKNYRPIGVGYATNDDADIRQNMADYFNCGDDQSQAIDFWGYNIYSWCGDSSFQESGYDVQTRNFESYSVPVFFAEYGCNTPSPREFSEVDALYGDQMTPVWSGGIVYMYFQEANKFGLVQINGDSPQKLPDFTALSSRLAKITPSGVNSNSYNPTNRPAACPATGTAWAAPASPLPPTPNRQLCSCMVETLACSANPGIDGDNIGQLFGQVCGYDDGAACKGINTNATNGPFGAYGMCNATEQLSWAFNAYYQSKNRNAQACDFGGNAATKSASSPESACSPLLQQAGSDGVGTVTSAPTGGAGSSSSGAASPMGVHHVSVGGVMSLGLYVFAAALSGAAMIFL